MNKFVAIKSRETVTKDDCSIHNKRQVVAEMFPDGSRCIHL